LSSSLPSPETDRILTLLRILLEPRTCAEERRSVADALASCTPEALAACLAQRRVASALRSLDVPYTATAEDHRFVSRPGACGRYNLGTDLRVLINDAFSARVWSVPVDVEGAVTVSERARLIGAAREYAKSDCDDVARGLAWTQFDPGAPLLRWQSDQDEQIAAYIQHALHRGGACSGIPVPFAQAVTRELACREIERNWFDSMYAWASAWTACAPLVAVERHNAQAMIRRLHRTLRIGVALRAAAADIRMPRLLALAELAGALAVIRAAGMADVIHAHRATDGDPITTAVLHQKGDRDANLLVEVSIGEVLRSLSPSEMETLHESERNALRFVTDLLSSDPRLQAGLLSDAELPHSTEADPSDGTP
jgi:hypothetical protein